MAWNAVLTRVGAECSGSNGSMWWPAHIVDSPVEVPDPVDRAIANLPQKGLDWIWHVFCGSMVQVQEASSMPVRPWSIMPTGWQQQACTLQGDWEPATTRVGVMASHTAIKIENVTRRIKLFLNLIIIIPIRSPCLYCQVQDGLATDGDRLIMCCLR